MSVIRTSAAVLKNTNPTAVHFGSTHRSAHVSVSIRKEQLSVPGCPNGVGLAVGGWGLLPFRRTWTGCWTRWLPSPARPIPRSAQDSICGDPGVSGRHCDRIYLSHVRRILSALGQRCTQILQGAGVRVQAPLAFYLFPDFSHFAKRLARRGITDSVSLCENLLHDTGVAVLPGAVFRRPREELTARIAYVGFDGAKALTASEAIPLDRGLPDDFIQRWCGDMIEATQRMANWATGTKSPKVVDLVDRKERAGG